MTLGIEPATTGALVVTYYPDPGFPERLQAILREFPLLLVWDNTDDREVSASIASEVKRIGARFATGSANIGLGTAFNRGFARLAELGATWICTFDQDSMPQSGFAAELLGTASRQLVDGMSVAAVGANWRDAVRMRMARHLVRHPYVPLAFRRVEALTDLASVDFVISSGCLTRLEAWRQLGGFDETLFIDLVDADFCLRAKRAGWTIAVSASSILQHHRGSKRAVQRFGRTWWPSCMPPKRLRYLFRNRVRLLLRHGRATPHWAIYEMTHSLKVLIEDVLLTSGRWTRLRAIIAGLCDAAHGRQGRLPED